VVRGWIALIAAVVAIEAAGKLLTAALNPYLVQVLTYIGINIILAVSLNLINGYTGQFSLGHAGFMALGAYASAAVTYYGAPVIAGLTGGFPGTDTVLFLFGLVVGGLVAALAGLLVGIPSLRLRGDYLAIATLGLGEIIRVVILNLDFVGGARGFTGIPERTDLAWVYLGAALTILVVHRMVASTRGRAFLAIREDEIAAEAMGIPTTRYKVIAFVVGAFFAGLGGGLFAHSVTYLHTNTFQFLKSIEFVVMVVLGGMGSITGSVIAAAVLTVLPELLRAAQELRMVIYSLLLIILMVARPEGLLGLREIRVSRIAPRFRRGRRAPAG
jgi:branched-chain amino acid transport system permease protein